MKKISLFTTLLFSVLCLTSCLEGGSNKRTATAYGVLDIGENFNSYVLNSTLMLDLGPVSSPQLSEWINSGEMELYKCYMFDFEIDLGIPENSYSMLQQNGYSTITINSYEELPTYHVNSFPADTAKALNDEVPVLNGYAKSSYGAEYMYLQQTVNQPEDQQLSWEMSYDYNTITNPTETGGARYYDLFVRAVKLTDGTKSNTDVSYLNAYHMSDFFNRAAENEKSRLGSNYTSNSTFKFRIFYANEIKDGVPAWKNVIQEAYIALFVEDGSE
jgi:hypothetical protein